jgi:hypothetical protein
MKKLALATIFLFAFAFGYAQDKTEKKETKSSHTMTGYLVDKMCGAKMSKLDQEKATEKAMKHSKDCALEDVCKEGGYGLMSNGKFFKFDENGDRLASEYFDKTKKEKDFLVDVRGSMDGDMMKVESIKDVKGNEKTMEKKEEAK